MALEVVARPCRHIFLLAAIPAVCQWKTMRIRRMENTELSKAKSIPVPRFADQSSLASPFDL